MSSRPCRPGARWRHASKPTTNSTKPPGPRWPTPRAKTPTPRSRCVIRSPSGRKGWLPGPASASPRPMRATRAIISPPPSPTDRLLPSAPGSSPIRAPTAPSSTAIPISPAPTAFTGWCWPTPAGWISACAATPSPSPKTARSSMARPTMSWSRTWTAMVSATKPPTARGFTSMANSSPPSRVSKR